MTTDAAPAPVLEDAAPPRRSPRRGLGLAVVIAVGALLAVVLGAGLGRNPRVVDSVLVDGPAPPLAGATLDGGRFDLADHRGEVVLVNVWASWCPPCRREYPLLQEAQRELGPLGVQLVGINTQDSDEEARAFLDGLGGENYPSVLDPDGRLAVEWGTFGVPETFVVDQQGRLVARQIGELSADWIGATVVPLLESP